MSKDKEAIAIEKVVAQQVGSGVKEIIISKTDWDLFGLHLQEVVNFVRYDLLDPPERSGRNKLIIAIKKVKA